jgi:hypothetical protein
VLSVALLAGACGGGSGNGAATNKADWQKRYGPAVSAVSIDVDSANEALTKGDRPGVLSSCNQLQDDLAGARKSLPVPDATVDGALRAGLDAVGTAVPTCIHGGQVANQADIVEQAQREMTTARQKMDVADKAIADWQ